RAFLECERSGKGKGPVRGPAGPQAQRPLLQFLADLLAVVLAFLALSSSAPLVYWLGGLCSLTAALVLRLAAEARLLGWVLQLLLRFSMIALLLSGSRSGFAGAAAPAGISVAAQGRFIHGGVPLCPSNTLKRGSGPCSAPATKCCTPRPPPRRPAA